MLLQMARLQNAKHKDFPHPSSLSRSICISRLFRAVPHTEYLMGVQGKSDETPLPFPHKILLLLFEFSPHNHWLEAYFDSQYLGLEILRIEIESLAVRVRLNILSRFPSSPG